MEPVPLLETVATIRRIERKSTPGHPHRSREENKDEDAGGAAREVVVVVVGFRGQELAWARSGQRAASDGDGG